MRIAIVDDLAGERALLREQLARQLAQKKSGVLPPLFWIFIWRA